VSELSDAADRARLRAAGRDIRIDFVDDTSTSDQTVRVSEADFGRVCDNLVGNAVAAIRDSGSIELRLGTEQAGVLLTVTDDGGGMDEAYVPFAFDRFSRQSAARTEGGAGLGLPIVAAITANSGGTIALTNTPGEGLRVAVQLPFAVSEDIGRAHPLRS
jgi:signal transduction histidine kinase